MLRKGMIGPLPLKVRFVDFSEDIPNWRLGYGGDYFQLSTCATQRRRESLKLGKVLALRSRRPVMQPGKF
jgi:hypothetical protein